MTTVLVLEIALAQGICNKRVKVKVLARMETMNQVCEQQTRPMKGRIYISGAFTTVVHSKCKQLGELDNDPHFWESPPTWGICRPDIRELLNFKNDNYIFFVLPKKSDLPQMIYGYMKIVDITRSGVFDSDRCRWKV